MSAKNAILTLFNKAIPGKVCYSIFHSINDGMFSTKSGKLQQMGTSRERGEDRLGPWASEGFRYKAGMAELGVSFRRYEDEFFRNCIVFGQVQFRYTLQVLNVH